jgi:prepilin-type processing-associated H-X9-DG protein
LSGRLDKVARSSETMLFADCGTRPRIQTSNALDYNDALFYTTNYMEFSTTNYKGTLRGVFETPWLKDRIPVDRPDEPRIKTGRHGKKLNVVFVDGHGETVLTDFFEQVRVSPYRY